MDELNLFARILNHFGYYMNQLDWGYIFTFFIMAYAFNKMSTKNKIKNRIPPRISLKWFPVIFGLLYACLLFFIRDCNFIEIEMLFKSFIFSIAFQHIVLKKFFSLLEDNNVNRDKEE